MIFDLKDLKTAERQYYLQHVIAPRPICFASTIDKAGNINLSPFSFFNLFSSNPPIVIFSPARRVRDNTTKHTLQNVLEVPEVVINIVTYDMVQQTSLSSCEYPKGTNEFIKAGFTPIPATLVKPPMVKESKVQLECKVIEVKPLGTEGGAGIAGPVASWREEHSSWPDPAGLRFAQCVEGAGGEVQCPAHGWGGGGCEEDDGGGLILRRSSKESCSGQARPLSEAERDC